MSTYPFEHIDRPGPFGKPVNWPVVASLAALFVAEAIVLCLFCRWHVLAVESWLWTELGKRFGMYAASLTTVALLFAGIGTRQRQPDGVAADPSWLRRCVVLVHVGAVLGFIIVTTILADVVPRERPRWLGSWLLLGTTALVSAAVLVLRVPIARRIGVVLAALGVVIAAHQASLLTGKFWEPLSSATLVLVESLLRLTGAQTVCRPADFLVGTDVFSVEVLQPCCGYQGIGLVTVFVGTYLVLCRNELRFPQALLLLPLGVLVIWLANVLRITSLILVGIYIAPEVAVNGFHSQAGWLLFNLVALGLIGAGQTLPFFSAARERHEGVNLHAAYLTPFLLIVLTSMITKAFSREFDAFYPVRVLASGAALWYFRKPLREALRWSFSYMALAIGVLVFAIWLLLEPATQGPSATAAHLAALPAWLAVGWVAFRIIGSVLTVPIAEELAFRGYLPRRFLNSDFQDVPLGRFTFLTFVATSLLFGVMHGRWLAGTIAGMLYALALCRRGKLCDAVTAHATTNGLIAVYAVLTGNWDLW